MKKIIDFFAVIIISFFGIGFIPNVSGVLTTIISALIFLILNFPDYIIYSLIVISILIYIPANLSQINGIFENKNINVFPKFIGTFFTLSSPVIYYSIEWILVSIFVFTVLSSNRTVFDRYLKTKIKNWSILIKDLTAGVVAGIVLHVLYAGWLISPYVLGYLEK
ncbi:MAG: hypothetical protein EPN82_03570 [Bacteroidetes bacterium]|nr:MAG: hypothetical protein EPN82_03570 [Bacteroidota bacterium]